MLIPRIVKKAALGSAVALTAGALQRLATFPPNPELETLGREFATVLCSSVGFLKQTPDPSWQTRPHPNRIVAPHRSISMLSLYTPRSSTDGPTHRPQP